MTWTTTVDASLKVKAAGSHLTHWAQHVAREADRSSDAERGHSNANIDPERTVLNETMVRDQAGNWVPATSSQDVVSAIKGRAEQRNEGTLRKDAVIARPLVLKLDPEWFEANNPDWRENGLNEEAQRLHGVMIEAAEEWFGERNVVSRSTHLDETTPEMQVAVVPLTDDGRLSQKDFFKSPAHLKKMHDHFRTKLREAGYEAEMGRTERSTERMSSQEYSRAADRARELGEELGQKSEELDRERASVAVDRARIEQTKGELAKEKSSLTGEREAWEAGAKKREEQQKQRGEQAFLTGNAAAVTQFKQRREQMEKGRRELAEERKAFEAEKERFERTKGLPVATMVQAYRRGLEDGGGQQVARKLAEFEAAYPTVDAFAQDQLRRFREAREEEKRKEERQAEGRRKLELLRKKKKQSGDGNPNPNEGDYGG